MLAEIKRNTLESPSPKQQKIGISEKKSIPVVDTYLNLELRKIRDTGTTGPDSLKTLQNLKLDYEYCTTARRIQLPKGLLKISERGGNINPAERILLDGYNNEITDYKRLIAEVDLAIHKSELCYNSPEANVDRVNRAKLEDRKNKLVSMGYTELNIVLINLQTQINNATDLETKNNKSIAENPDQITKLALLEKHTLTSNIKMMTEYKDVVIKRLKDLILEKRDERYKIIVTKKDKSILKEQILKLGVFSKAKEDETDIHPEIKKYYRSAFSYLTNAAELRLEQLDRIEIQGKKIDNESEEAIGQTYSLYLKACSDIMITRGKINGLKTKITEKEYQSSIELISLIQTRMDQIKNSSFEIINKKLTDPQSAVDSYFIELSEASIILSNLQHRFYFGTKNTRIQKSMSLVLSEQDKRILHNLINLPSKLVGKDKVLNTDGFAEFVQYSTTQLQSSIDNEGKVKEQGLNLDNQLRSVPATRPEAIYCTDDTPDERKAEIEQRNKTLQFKLFGLSVGETMVTISDNLASFRARQERHEALKNDRRLKDPDTYKQESRRKALGILKGTVGVLTAGPMLSLMVATHFGLDPFPTSNSDTENLESSQIVPAKKTLSQPNISNKSTLTAISEPNTSELKTTPPSDEQVKAKLKDILGEVSAPLDVEKLVKGVEIKTNTTNLIIRKPLPKEDPLMNIIGK